MINYIIFNSEYLVLLNSKHDIVHYNICFIASAGKVSATLGIQTHLVIVCCYQNYLHIIRLYTGMAEFYDSQDILKSKYGQLFEVVTKSTNMVFFTGAGISTAAKIPGK